MVPRRPSGRSLTTPTSNHCAPASAPAPDIVTVRRVELRQLAAADISDAADHYQGEGGEPIALRFIDAVERAVGRIGRSPHIGSLRFSYELEIPDLRAWPLDRFPYIVFYLVADDHIDVWRVLHSRRDIPTALIDDVE